MKGIKFEPIKHEYTSIGDMPKIDWISGTRVVGDFHEKFDSKAIAKKSSKGRGKWKGIPYQEIMQIWEDEKNRAIKDGNWYHDQREQDILLNDTLDGLKVYHPEYNELNEKIITDTILEDGIYPELMVYLESVGVCGQSDLVKVIEGKVHIIDYKTSKTINMSSYVNWEGKSKKMLSPISHLDDCNGIHYGIQLSLYMYIILQHNPWLDAGDIQLHHVKFVKESENEYGYPIYRRVNGEPVVESVEIINVPYYEKEIIAILNTYRK